MNGTGSRRSQRLSEATRRPVICLGFFYGGITPRCYYSTLFAEDSDEIAFFNCIISCARQLIYPHLVCSFLQRDTSRDEFLGLSFKWFFGSNDSEKEMQILYLAYVVYTMDIMI